MRGSKHALAAATIPLSCLCELCLQPTTLPNILTQRPALVNKAGTYHMLRILPVTKLHCFHHFKPSYASSEKTQTQFRESSIVIKQLH